MPRAEEFCPFCHRPLFACDGRTGHEAPEWQPDFGWYLLGLIQLLVWIALASIFFGPQR